MATGLLSLLSHDEIGTLYSNTICVHNESIIGGGGSDDFNDIVEACVSWFKTEYLACLPNMVVLDAFRLVGVGGDAGKLGERLFTDAGTRAANGALPREVTRIISWRTSRAGRSGRGHIALPSCRDSDVMTSAGNYSAGNAYTTQCVALKDKLLAGHDWNGVIPVDHLSLRVWSRTLVQSFDVTTGVVRSLPRWVERRQTVP